LEVLDADTAEVEIDAAEVGAAVTVDMDPAAAARETGRTAAADKKARVIMALRTVVVCIYCKDIKKEFSAFGQTVPDDTQKS